MEVLGLMGFILAISALAKIRKLEARLKEAGLLNEPASGPGESGT